MLKKRFLELIELMLKYWSGLDKEKLKLSPKRFTFLFFLLLSTILWFLNALSREYTDSVDFPIRYANYPEDFILLNDPPNELELEVKAFGYSLFYHKITPDLLPLRIDFSKTPLRLLQDGDTMSYFIESRYLQSEISQQISSEINLNGIKPDSIIFTFTKTISKKVPISLNHELSFKPPFQLKQAIQIIPDSIIIRGPQALVHNIDTLYTQPLTSKPLNEDKIFEIALEEHKYINKQTKNVKAIVKLEKYTQSEMSIPFTIKNLPDSLVLIPFPNQLRIHFTTSLDNFKTIGQFHFKAVLDYNDTKRSISNKIPVHIEKVTSLVRDLNYNPKNIEFIVEKK